MSVRDRRTKMRTQAYTLIEMVVVCVIVMLAVALVVPRIGGGSKRMGAERALSAFREAYGETAMRARATGKPLALVLQPEEMLFQVVADVVQLDKDWHPALLQAETGAEGKAAILPGAASYPVPEGVEWTELPDFTDGYDGIAYVFYPDGEAMGAEIAWTMFDRSYRLIMDSVLGKATILEEEK